MRARRRAAACVSCGRTPLSKDEIGLNLKLVDPEAESFRCLTCLAEWMDATPEDMEDLIARFREEGCALFQE